MGWGGVSLNRYWAKSRRLFIYGIFSWPLRSRGIDESKGGGGGGVLGRCLLFDPGDSDVKGWGTFISVNYGFSCILRGLVTLPFLPFPFYPRTCYHPLQFQVSD